MTLPESFFGKVAFIAQTYAPLFLKGTGVTLLVSITGTIFGFFIGLGVACVRTIPLQPGDSRAKRALLGIANALLTAYIELFRGTPMIVQGMIVYYGFMQYLHIDMNPIVAGIFVISINTGAYMAEIIRGGVISIDKGQFEGAQSIGMSHWQTMTNVVFPQAIRNIMPSIGNEFVVNIKDSSVLSVISVTELFFQSRSASGTYLLYFETMVITCAIYLVLTMTVTRILLWLEGKMDGPQSYTIHGSQTAHGTSIQVKGGSK